MSANEKSMKKVEESSNSSVELDKEDPPWKLQPIFTFKGVKDGKYEYKCNFCPTTQILMKVNLKSRSNLRRHLERTHKTQKLLEDYDKLCQSTKVKRDCNYNKSMDEYLVSKSFNAKPSQAKLDSAVVNMIISANLPFTFVREPSFKDLISLCQPGMKVLSYETLIRKMECQVNEMHENMLKAFEKIAVCCVTADGWTAASRSWLGVTIHWLEGMTRKSAVLACKRILGRHTHDNLAKHLEEILVSYGLSDKVGGGCVTDNAANFVACFEAFGVSFKDSLGESDAEITEENVNNVISEVKTTTLKLRFVDDGHYDMQDLADVMEQNEIFDTDEIEDIPIDIFDIETTLDEHTYTLPEHFRCAAHTLNLVAKSDVEKYLKNFDKGGNYKKISRKVMSKLTAVWNLQNRSTNAADVIKEKCGKKFITPVATRWNSLQNSVKRVYELIEKSNDNLKSLFTTLKIVHLTDVSTYYFV